MSPPPVAGRVRVLMPLLSTTRCLYTTPCGKHTARTGHTCDRRRAGARVAEGGHTTGWMAWGRRCVIVGRWCVLLEIIENHSY